MYYRFALLIKKCHASAIEKLVKSSAPLQKLILNPVLEVADFHVDAGHVDLPAADAPRHDSGQLPHSVDFADQGAATVALSE